MRAKSLVFPFLIVIAFGQLLAGCSRNETPLSADTTSDAVLAAKGAVGVGAPGNLVSVTYGGETLVFWPYLTPDGTTTEDPVNFVFVGAAGAREIRAALLALDGNRTAYGFPNVYPFNATWADAMGGVQAGYVEGAEWLGGVIQLQAGNYGPVRVHLRLFDTGIPYGDSGEWTLGGSHIELQVPGTPEHQVLAWEFAEQMVYVDMVRTGLLLAGAASTDLINDAPGFRTIPPAIYNGIPDQLKVPLGLPAGPSAVPVPIPNNGHATVLKLGPGSSDLGDGSIQTLTVQFEQIIPKPFCAAGPADYYVVEGPVNMRKHVTIDEAGRFSYQYQLSGELTATPAGGGEPFNVRIHDIQNGFVDDSHASVHASVQRIAPQDGGSELLKQWLKVGTNGQSQFSKLEHCLTP